jgi:hypothetical protein
MPRKPNYFPQVTEILATFMDGRLAELEPVYGAVASGGLRGIEQLPVKRAGTLEAIAVARSLRCWTCCTMCPAVCSMEMTS